METTGGIPTLPTRTKDLPPSLYKFSRGMILAKGGKKKKMSKLNIEYIKTGELIPYVNNPRNNENAIDVVAGSIKEFGFKNPIIIDKDNVIIAGHTRLLASRKLGLEEVPVIRAEDLTEQQVKAFRIADNKTSEFAEWGLF